MAAYRKSIADLESLKAKNNNVIKNQLGDLGRQIVLLKDEQTKDAPFYDIIAEIRLKETELSEKEATISSWNELSEKLDANANDLRLLDAEIADKRLELEPHFETIGEAVLDAYQSSDEELGELSNRAEHIVEIQEEIRNKERELQALESGDRQESFLGKTLAAGKGMVIRGSLKSRGARRRRALREIGERICEMDATDSTETQFTQVLFPVREAMGELAGLRGRRETLEKAKVELQNGRLEIEKQERMRNPVRNLGHAVDLLRTQIDELAARIGSSYVESGFALENSVSAIDSVIAATQMLREENERAQEIIEKLNAAIVVDRLSEQIEGKKAAKSRLESEIASVDAGIDELKSQKTAQAKTRGSIASVEAALIELIGEPEKPD
jgi:chromosome segregation ATPase